MISMDRKEEIYDSVNTIGLVQTCINENLPERTIKDYVRRYKQYMNETVLSDNPTITLFDIETDFMKNATWGLWKQNIHIGQILESW